MNITRIEVSFAIPVELTDEEHHILHQLISSIAKRTQPDGRVHWLAGCGSKPHFSASDSVFLGKRPASADTLAPANGEEPTWSDDVYYLETCCRER